MQNEDLLVLGVYKVLLGLFGFFLLCEFRYIGIVILCARLFIGGEF